jgi:hypothetical protein
MLKTTKFYCAETLCVDPVKVGEPATLRDPKKHHDLAIELERLWLKKMSMVEDKSMGQAKHNIAGVKPTPASSNNNNNTQGPVMNTGAGDAEEESTYRSLFEASMGMEAGQLNDSQYMEIITHLCKQYNIKKGQNPLHDLFSFLQKHEISNLFTACCPDILHTIRKGLVEYSLIHSGSSESAGNQAK